MVSHLPSKKGVQTKPETKRKHPMRFAGSQLLGKDVPALGVCGVGGFPFCYLVTKQSYSSHSEYLLAGGKPNTRTGIVSMPRTYFFSPPRTGGGGSGGGWCFPGHHHITGLLEINHMITFDM